MNIAVFVEGVFEGFVVGEMGEQAKLYLGIIGTEDAVRFVLRYESGADFPSDFGTDGNVLEVWIA